MQNSVQKLYHFLWQIDSFGSLSQLLECKASVRLFYIQYKNLLLTLKVYAQNISITTASIRGSLMPSPLTDIYLLKHLTPFNFFSHVLKELRNRITRNVLVWSLFYLILLNVGLHFLRFLLENQFFYLSVLSLNQDIKICVIMLCNFDM